MQVFNDWRDEVEPIKRRCGFLFELHDRGIKLSEDRIALLHRYRYLQRDKSYVKKKGHDPNVFSAYSANTAVAAIAAIRKIEKPVQTEDWMPSADELNNYTPEFVAWIDSINAGFNTRKSYHRFDLYCRQAEQWTAKGEHFTDFDDAEAQFQWAVAEKTRCQENSLYFLNKYLQFKVGASIKQYTAHQAQKIVAFLIDSGFCLMIGKGRQIWFSTTVGGIAIKRINFNKTYFVKFIAENLVKSLEIFEDKIKYPFYHLPDWMKSSVQSDQERQLKLLFKGSGAGKGSVSGADSKLFCEAPYITAINGGSPDLVLIDEIGQVPLLGDIIDEGRPTLYSFDTATSKLVRTRQLCAWGTGGNVDRGGAEFEQEFLGCLDRWEKRDFSYGIIPIFFDWWARPGITQEHYDQQKEIAYASGKEEKKVRFHQHYPTNIQDMFLSSAETVIPISHINSAINRINNREKKNISGHFEPIYDTARKMPENFFVPYAVTGARFVPSTIDDEAPITIYKYPEEGWVNRYHQGTDPIASQSGYSYLSSAIWDSLEKTVPAVLNARSRDYRTEYLQSHLMNLFYGRPPHLVEINVGRELVNFIELLGGYKDLVPQSMLPQSLHVNSTEVIGIKKVAANTPFIHNRLIEMLEAYKDNINIKEFFIQLKTFVKKETAKGGTTNFDVTDYRYHRNDIIYGVLYAYISAECYSHREPRNISQTQKKREVTRLVCNKSTGWTNQLQKVWV